MWLCGRLNSSSHRSNAVFLIVGRVSESYDIEPLVQELGLNDVVKITGHVDKEMLQRYVEACDVCVNLRFPTCGETSAVVLRAMSAAKPLIVSDVGSFAELTDDCCIKVGIDSEEVANVAVAFNRLADNRDERREMGMQGSGHIREQHDPTRIAQEYMGFIEQVLSGSRESESTRQHRKATSLALSHSKVVAEDFYSSPLAKVDEIAATSSIDVIEIVRGVRESVRLTDLATNVSNGVEWVRNLPDSVLDPILRYHVKQADLASGDLFVGDQMRQSCGLPGMLITQARKPLHSLARFYLDLFAERQAGFNYFLAKALMTFSQELDTLLDDGSRDDIQEMHSTVDALRQRAARLERLIDELHKNGSNAGQALD